MKFLYVLPILLYLIGCGSNYDIITGGGNQCVPGYDPLPTDMEQIDPDNFGNAASKVLNAQSSDKLPDFDSLSDGTYRFNGAEAFFHDTSNDVMIHVQVPANPDNTQAPANRQCVSNMQKVINSPLKNRTAKMVTSFTVKNKNVSSLQVQTIGYDYVFVQDRPDLTSLQTAVSDPKAGIESATTTADLKKIYRKYDHVKLYCVGACNPNDNPKTYQIRANRTMTRKKGGDSVYIEVMSSFIIDKNKN